MPHAYPPVAAFVVLMGNTIICFQVGFQAIAEALGLAAVKAAVAITAIIAGGRLVSGMQKWGVRSLINMIYNDLICSSNLVS